MLEKAKKFIKGEEERKKVGDYKFVGTLKDYSFDKKLNTKGKGWLKNFKPNRGYFLQNYEVSENKLVGGDSEGILVTDKEYKKIARTKAENPSTPFGVKPVETTVKNYLEDKSERIEIKLYDKEKMDMVDKLLEEGGADPQELEKYKPLLTPYRSGQFVKDFDLAKKMLYDENDLILRHPDKKVMVAGRNGETFQKMFFHAEPEKVEDIENQRLFYNELEILEG